MGLNMEHRFIINYTMDDQTESLEVITDSENLSAEEARKRVEVETKPYGEKIISNISVAKVDTSENIDTDPETSASE